MFVQHFFALAQASQWSNMQIRPRRLLGINFRLRRRRLFCVFPLRSVLIPRKQLHYFLHPCLLPFHFRNFEQKAKKMIVARANSVKVWELAVSPWYVSYTVHYGKFLQKTRHSRFKGIGLQKTGHVLKSEEMPCCKICFARNMGNVEMVCPPSALEPGWEKKAEKEIGKVGEEIISFPSPFFSLEIIPPVQKTRLEIMIMQSSFFSLQGRALTFVSHTFPSFFWVPLPRIINRDLRGMRGNWWCALAQSPYRSRRRLLFQPFCTNSAREIQKSEQPAPPFPSHTHRKKN